MNCVQHETSNNKNSAIRMFHRFRYMFTKINIAK
uniref:Uncharacterized protein n=1 Tax=Anguilla anguilla TaxID=7936 RepID=A0A0E9SEK5_ANGAN